MPVTAADCQTNITYVINDMISPKTSGRLAAHRTRNNFASTSYKLQLFRFCTFTLFYSPCLRTSHLLPRHGFHRCT
jgi:hypothetical protein